MTTARPEDPRHADAPADGVLHPEQRAAPAPEDDQPLDLAGPTELGSTDEG